MEADAERASRTGVGAELAPEVIADLALSGSTSVLWSADFEADELTWRPGMAALLGAGTADDETVRARLSGLIRPLTLAARTAGVWQDFELEQQLDGDAAETDDAAEDGNRWIRIRARTFGDGRIRGLVGIATDVTGQHADRRELADLADRYRLLIELSPDAICVHESGLLRYVNPAGVRFIGASSPDELIGKPITDFVDTESVSALLTRIGSLSTPGAASEPAEAVLSRLDGKTVLVESVSVRTTWEGRPAYQVIMRDITEQKAAQAALHYQAALVSHVSDAIIATDSDGLVTSWNPAAEQVYGRRAADAAGKHVSDVVGAPLDPTAVVEDGGVLQAEHRSADGRALAVRVSAAAMDSGYVLVCADETARRRAEEHFRTVVASLDEGVVVVGPTGRVESANPAALRILGWAEKDFIGLDTMTMPLFDESGAPLLLTRFTANGDHRPGDTKQSRIIRMERPDGSSVWLSYAYRPLDPRDRTPTSLVVSFSDITERRAISERLAHEATHDPLTSLANRTLVLRLLNTSTAVAVLFIDLDKFKVINDSLGHEVGDQVLKLAGRRLCRAASEDDLVGRLGGDEFVLVTRTVTGKAEAARLARRLREALVEPIVVHGRQLRVDASIGVVLAAAGDPRSAEDLLRDADVAMYQAKTRGRGRHELFDVELRERLQRRLRLEQDLRKAVENGELWAAYQPVIDLRTGRMVAVEGLLRWSHPEHGAVSPTEFIPLAEESDLINLVGRYMLETTTRQLAATRERHGLDMHLKVNLSTRQLDDTGLVPAVRETLRRTGLPPRALCLEITESALMRDPAAAAGVLGALRALGVRLAIDDFGTGYSSLAQLQRLPLDTLKIDRSFVVELGGSHGAEVIVTSVIALAHAVGLTVVAEGVETAVQLAVLKRLGCDQAQGYYLGKPARAEELFPDGPDARPTCP